jgi:hypothetical protein
MMSLSELRLMYFTRRNGFSRQFEFKLHNALRVTMKYPKAYEYVGAIWISPSVTKVNACAFANLLGIQTVQGALFHKQGNFSRHGFTHLLRQSSPEFASSPDCDDVDDYNVRLYTDRSQRFLRDRTLEPRGELVSFTSLSIHQRQ